MRTEPHEGLSGQLQDRMTDRPSMVRNDVGVEEDWYEVTEHSMLMVSRSQSVRRGCGYRSPCPDAVYESLEYALTDYSLLASPVPISSRI